VGGACRGTEDNRCGPAVAAAVSSPSGQRGRPSRWPNTVRIPAPLDDCERPPFMLSGGVRGREGPFCLPPDAMLETRKPKHNNHVP